MAGGEVHGGRVSVNVGLPVAGLIMFVASASVLGLAVMSVTGSAPRIDASSVAPLVVAAWLALAGVAMVRRRHYAFALLTPAALAVLNLGYTLGTGRLEGIGGVIWMLIPVMLVAGSRSAFRD